MSLVKGWRDAKRRYDEAQRVALRKIKPLEAHLSAAEFYLEALQNRRLDDKAHMRQIRTYLDDFSPETIQKTKAQLAQELSAEMAVEARPACGLEQALADLERVLGAAENLIAKGEVSPSYWNQYREIYAEYSRKLMAANDSFEAFSSKRANMEAKLALRLDHAALLKQIGQRSRAVHLYLQENDIAG